MKSSFVLTALKCPHAHRAIALLSLVNPTWMLTAELLKLVPSYAHYILSLPSYFAAEHSIITVRLELYYPWLYKTVYVVPASSVIIILIEITCQQYSHTPQWTSVRGLSRVPKVVLKAVSTDRSLMNICRCSWGGKGNWMSIHGGGSVELTGHDQTCI